MRLAVENAGPGCGAITAFSARIKQPVYSAEYYIRPAIPPIWLGIGCYVSALQLQMWADGGDTFINFHQSESDSHCACQAGK